MIISGNEYEEIIDRIVKNLLNSDRPGGAWFGGSEVKFDEWAGDVFGEIVYLTLRELGVEVDFSKEE